MVDENPTDRKSHVVYPGGSTINLGLTPDIQQKFTKRGKKRPQDLVIPDEINAFKAEQWIENLRKPAELAGLVPYTVAQERSEWFPGPGPGAAALVAPYLNPTLEECKQHR
uniref:Uncharacterized protein n=1 Tax=Timema cristinae TaxID=61476 RepID=A0A7R9DH71_TIMCR|nr:unnamed protein product [Timema cristinae]